MQKAGTKRTGGVSFWLLTSVSLCFRSFLLTCFLLNVRSVGRLTGSSPFWKATICEFFFSTACFSSVTSPECFLLHSERSNIDQLCDWLMTVPVTLLNLCAYIATSTLSFNLSFHLFCPSSSKLPSTQNPPFHLSPSSLFFLFLFVPVSSSVTLPLC